MVGFPMAWDSATFWDNVTKVSLLYRDKGTTGQAQNLATGQDGPGQPVKIWEGTWDGTGFSYFATGRDFDSLSRPVPENSGITKGQKEKKS